MGKMKKTPINIISIDGHKRYKSDDSAKKIKSVIARKTIKVLKRRSRHNSIVLGVLEYDWPVAISMIETLSEYIGHTLCYDDEPIIYPVIEFALECYGKFLFHGYSKKHEDAVRLAAFMDGLLTKTCEVAQEVKSKQPETKIQTLSMVNKRTLSADWVNAELDESGLSGLRRSLYELIVNEHVKHILKSANYEQAVVLGGVGVSH